MADITTECLVVDSTIVDDVDIAVHADAEIDNVDGAPIADILTGQNIDDDDEDTTNVLAAFDEKPEAASMVINILFNAYYFTGFYP